MGNSSLYNICQEVSAFGDWSLIGVSYEWTGSMSSASAPGDPTVVSLYIQDSGFKRNHIYLSYIKSEHLV